VQQEVIGVQLEIIQAISHFLGLKFIILI